MVYHLCTLKPIYWHFSFHVHIVIGLLLPVRQLFLQAFHYAFVKSINCHFLLFYAITFLKCRLSDINGSSCDHCKSQYHTCLVASHFTGLRCSPEFSVLLITCNIYWWCLEMSKLFEHELFQETWIVVPVKIFLCLFWWTIIYS